MTCTLTRSPRGFAIADVNWAKNPNLARSSQWWGSLWFGAGGGGTDTVQSGLTWLPAYLGTHAMSRTWSTAPTGAFNLAGFTYTIDTWPAGQEFTCSVYVLYPSAPQTFQCQVEFLDAAGAVIDTVQSAPIAAPTNTLTRLSVTATNRLGAAAARFDYFLDGTGTRPVAGAGFLATGVQISGTTEPVSYFDGDVAAASDVSYAWAGAAGNSPSNRMVPDPATIVQPRLLLTWAHSRANRNVLHEIDARADPDVSLKPAGSRAGTITLLFDEPWQAFRADVAFSGAGTWHLVDDELDLDLELVQAGDLSLTVDPDGDTAQLALPFREVLV